MNDQAAPSEITLIFPEFARLAKYLLDHEIDPETVGFIVGKATRDLWTGAAVQAASVLGEERLTEIAQEVDLEKRFGLLKDEYQKATGIDIQANLGKAAEAIVAEIVKEG